MEVLIMSNSYKRTPYCGDHKGKRKKKVANRKVRRKLKSTEIVFPRAGYRRITNPYDICDYYSIESWESYWLHVLCAWEQYEKPYGKPYPDERIERSYYEKVFKRK